MALVMLRSHGSSGGHLLQVGDDFDIHNALRVFDAEYGILRLMRVSTETKEIVSAMNSRFSAQKQLAREGFVGELYEQFAQWVCVRYGCFEVAITEVVV